MKFRIPKCHAPGLHILDEDIVYSPNKFRETEGRKAFLFLFEKWKSFWKVERAIRKAEQFNNE